MQEETRAWRKPAQASMDRKPNSVQKWDNVMFGNVSEGEGEDGLERMVN